MFNLVIGVFFELMGLGFIAFRQHISRVGRQTPPLANLVGGILMMLIGIGAIMAGLQHR